MYRMYVDSTAATLHNDSCLLYLNNLTSYFLEIQHLKFKKKKKKKMRIWFEFVHERYWLRRRPSFLLAPVWAIFCFKDKPFVPKNVKTTLHLYMGRPVIRTKMLCRKINLGQDLIVGYVKYNFLCQALHNPGLPSSCKIFLELTLSRYQKQTLNWQHGYTKNWTSFTRQGAHVFYAENLSTLNIHYTKNEAHLNIKLFSLQF